MNTTLKKLLCILLAFLLSFSVLGSSSVFAAGTPVYDESDAKKVSVSVTLSSDGIPLLANDADQTVMAALSVEVPYFDLDLYGMAGFYRFETKDGMGDYVSDKLIQRPTFLHLYIYLLERYYMGLSPEECCKGTSGVLNYNGQTDVRTMDGKLAYSSAGRKCVEFFGSPTALYMTSFWGHDENMLYYRNHTFPEMKPGYGATIDYILLSDGDTVDIAMFTDWDFMQTGRFLQTEQYGYTISEGDTETFRILENKITESSITGSTLTSAKDVRCTLYNSAYQKVCDLTAGQNGSFSYAFQTPGTYYILATGTNAGTASADTAPAFAKVYVRSDEETPKSICLSASKTDLFEGDTVTISLALTESLKNIVATEFTLRFDSGCFAYKSSSVSAAGFSVSAVKTDAKGAYLSISFVDRTSEGVTIPKGKVCDITFEALKTKSERKASFTLEHEGTYKTGLVQIPVAVEGEAKVQIHPVKPTHLSVLHNPQKMVYNYKDKFDSKGLVLELTYNNGDKEEVQSGFTVSPDAFRAKGLPMFGVRGTVPVEIRYGELTTTLSVQVRLSPLQWLIKILLFGWLWY